MKLHPLTSMDVSRYLGVTEQHGFKVLASARIKPIKVHGQNYYQYSQLADLDLERWEKGHKFNNGDFTPVPIKPSDALQKKLIAIAVEIFAAFPSGGEGRLCAAVIVQAIRDLFNRHYSKEALRFLASDIPQARLFLGDYAAEWIRRMIREYYLLGDI